MGHSDLCRLGPKTAEGLARCAEAKAVHGRETRAIRRERGIKSAELLLLEELMFKLGMLRGARTRGRKPNAYWEVKRVRADA
jgi:hypothetical protein